MEIKNKLVVIVPAFNEEEIIAKTISALRESLRNFNLADSFIFVIDDGSKDRTREIAETSGADLVIVHKINQGLGAAVRSGLNAAKKFGADYVVKFDADLQHDPSDIPILITPLVAGLSDIVYGNRFSQIDYHMPLIRRYGNRVFTKLMAWLTGWPLKDSQPGIFAINKSYLDCFFIPGDYNYTQQILLDAFHKGMRFEHVNVKFTKRFTGKSFITLKYPMKVIPQILMVLVSVRPMRVFVPLAAMFFGSGMLIFISQFYFWIAGHSDRPVENVNLVFGLLTFGLQIFFFGVLAELIIQKRR